MQLPLVQPLYVCRSIDDRLPLSEGSKAFNNDDRVSARASKQNSASSSVAWKSSVHEHLPQVVALLAAGYQCSSNLLLALDSASQQDSGPLLCFDSSVSTWARLALERKNSSAQPVGSQLKSSRLDSAEAFKVQQVSSVPAATKVSPAVERLNTFIDPLGVLLPAVSHSGVTKTQNPIEGKPWALSQLSQTHVTTLMYNALLAPSLC